MIMCVFPCVLEHNFFFIRLLFMADDMVFYLWWRCNFSFENKLKENTELIYRKWQLTSSSEARREPVQTLEGDGGAGPP